MKAFLLAAGLGTRLRPLTDTTPKCLIPICGKPLMEWWFELFLRHGIDEALVNTHYLNEQVSEFIAEYNKRNTGLTVHEFYEPMLLGSGGTVAANKAFVKGEDSFLICYADNLTNIDLSALLRFHESYNGLLTMALFRAALPKQCGIAELDGSGRIVDFVEKPEQPRSDLANAGVYVVRQGIFNFFPCGFCDFGKDVLPKLTGNMYGYEIDDYLIDIGTPENLSKARTAWNYDHI